MFSSRLAFLLLALPAFGAWPNGYTYRATATVQSGKITGTLTNWAGLLSLSDANLKDVGHGGAIQHTNSQSGAVPVIIPADFLVTSDAAGSTQITGVEFEQYSALAGTATVWINVPSAAVGTSVYLFYGNSSVTVPPGTPSNTWNSNYISVYHMDENASNTTIHDSTSNANNGTNAANTSGKTTTGQIAQAITYNGTSDDTTTSMTRTSAFTWEVWADVTTVPGIGSYATIMSVDGANYILFDVQGTVTGLAMSYWSIDGLAGGQQGTPNPLMSSVWLHLAWTRSGDSTTGGYNFYVNGTAYTAANTTTITSGNTITLGNRPSFPQWFGGNLDEVRNANTAFSAAWIAADFTNQNQPSSFWSITYDQVPSNATCTISLLGAGPC